MIQVSVDTPDCRQKKGLYTTFLLSFDLLLKSVNTRIFRLVILGSTYNVFYTNNSNHKWGVSSMLYSCYCTIDLNQLLTKSTVRIFKTVIRFLLNQSSVEKYINFFKFKDGIPKIHYRKGCYSKFNLTILN